MSSTRLTEEFETKSVTLRGTTYKFKELSAAEYESIIKLAAGPDDNAELNTVLRLMAVKSIIEPKVTAAELEGKAYPVYAELLRTVNVMHFSGITPDENKNGKGEDGETPNA